MPSSLAQVSFQELKAARPNEYGADLVIVRIGKDEVRAMVSDTCWRDRDEEHPEFGRTIHVIDADGVERPGIKAADVLYRVRLKEASELVGQVDLLEFCRCACEWNEAATGDANWNHVLGHPWRYLDEAFLGGAEVPHELEGVTG